MVVLSEWPVDCNYQHVQLKAWDSSSSKTSSKATKTCITTASVEFFATTATASTNVVCSLQHSTSAAQRAICIFSDALACLVLQYAYEALNPEPQAPLFGPATKELPQRISTSSSLTKCHKFRLTPCAFPSGCSRPLCGL